ncbi:MAG TPA: MFS transporter [Phycisphaerae bacterium]|nr:MFS transporter [Phycisphaerae bacterium]
MTQPPSPREPLNDTDAQLPEPVDYASPQPHDPYIALRNPNYRRYFIGNGCSLLGMQMTTFTVGYELFERTNSPLLLGCVGLVQVIPIIAFALPVGHLLDRMNRKSLVIAATMGQTVLFLLMGLSSRFMPFLHLPESWRWLGDAHVPIMFLLLLLNGCCRAVSQPAKQSLMPLLIPAEHFPNAITWSSFLFETTNMVGPMLGGILLAAIIGPDHHHTWAYAVIYFINAACQSVQWLNVSRVKLDHTPKPHEPMTLNSMLAGVRFVFRNKIILGAITLDMFAVLLGGATMMLPVFAKQVIHAVPALPFLNALTDGREHIGPIGLAVLRAASSVGAITTGLILAHRPPMEKAGRNLLWAVAGFGIATIIFGLSQNFFLSFIALYFTGVFDNISVIIRHSLVQLTTPDEMRGRVSAVNSVFISTSNEMGEFESGTTTALASTCLRSFSTLSPILWGPMIAVAAGGAGTIAVVATAGLLWPELRSVKRLAELKKGN